MIKRKVLVDGEALSSLIDDLNAEAEAIQESLLDLQRSIDSVNDIRLEIKRAIKPKKQVIHGKEKDK